MMTTIDFRLTAVTLFILVCTFSSLSSGLSVYVDQKRGKDDVTCLNGSLSVPCFNISYIASQFESSSQNVTVHVVGEIEVDTLVTFRRMLQLSVIGTNHSKVLCVRSNKSEHSCQIPNCRQSGLWFDCIESLQIQDLTIDGCGVLRAKDTNRKSQTTGVAITGSKDVTLQAVTLTHSTGTSLLVEGTSDSIFLVSVTIRDILLNKTSVPSKTSFTGGVQIFLSKPSICVIINCTFDNISTPRVTTFDPSTQPDVDESWLGFGLGGGLTVIFYSENSLLSIEHSSFKNNTASLGGGAYIKFAHNSSNSSIIVSNSRFLNCRSRISGGLYVTFSKTLQKNLNHMAVKNCEFSGNRAEYGGGTHIQAFYGTFPQDEYVNIFFVNCTWQNNTARYSPAVDLSPSMFDILGTGLLPTVVFKDCTITENENTQKHTESGIFVNFGVFVISRFRVIFAGMMKFQSNNGTALLINSGRAVFKTNSQIEFTNNTGFHGGAIALHGYSSLLVNDNSYFIFLQNSAAVVGGAIYYYSIEQKEFFEGRACFISYNGSLMTPVTERNITFEFINNTAPTGSSIFASSFFPCYYAFSGNLHNHKIQEFFTNLGNFSFDGVHNSTCIHQQALATSSRFILSSKGFEQLNAIPGKKLLLPLTTQDELKHTVNSQLFARINDSNIILESPYTVNNSIKLFGSPNSIASLVLATTNPFHGIQRSTNITLLSCPPGFYWNENKKSCACSSSIASEAFPSIPRCEHHNFTAYLAQGYWIGNYNKTLYTAQCYFQFCKTTRGYFLPNTSDELLQFICPSTRTGILCSKCVQNHSTYYHSPKFTCGPGETDDCSYGPIYYVLSELIPLLVFFTIIVIFDISFSSGGKNGLIFFCQMIKIMPLEWTTLNLPSEFRYLQSGYNLLYGIFNFEFFSVEQLSFCLFKGATVMDILAFKYISAVFAFALVVVLAICLNHCSCCDKLCKIMKAKVTKNVSVLHGLSACLVICYTECVLESVRILRKVCLTGAGGSVGPAVAFYAGLDYLGTEHIRYALPAIFTLVTVGFIPPFLLLFYPSALRLLQLCSISEHRVVLRVLKYSRIEKLLPMFDSFQGCFKDNLRFFAGLYFVYRILILLPYLLVNRISGYVSILEIALVVIFTLHSIVQPYKKRKHNIIDSCLFGNLAVINGLSSLVFYKLPFDCEACEIEIAVVLYIQLVLIYMPAIALVGFAMWKLSKKVCTKYTRSDYELIESFSDNREE